MDIIDELYTLKGYICNDLKLAQAIANRTGKPVAYEPRVRDTLDFMYRYGRSSSPILDPRKPHNPQNVKIIEPIERK